MLYRPAGPGAFIVVWACCPAAVDQRQLAGRALALAVDMCFGVYLHQLLCTTSIQCAEGIVQPDKQQGDKAHAWDVPGGWRFGCEAGRRVRWAGFL